MPYFVIDNFRRGVDTSRPAFNAPGGTLAVGKDVHLTKGGDIETRKAFVKIATLPAGTFGLMGLRDTIYTFGSIAAPTMPGGFTYQRLQNPTAAAMTKVVDTEPFDGEPFVIAKFTDDTRVFYAGSRVADFDPGVCRFRFSVVSGTASAGVNKLSSVTVDGVEILGTAVDYATSEAATAAAIAAQINTYASGFTARVPAGTAEVCVTSPDDTASGDAVVLTPAGNLVLSADAGVMEPPIDAPTSCRTAGAKLYVTGGPYLTFSAVLDATNFSPNSIGGGFLNISTHASGGEELMGSELYYDDLMVFAKGVAQRWGVDADPTNNALRQTFRNTGLVAPRAACSYLDGPTFFLSRYGVKLAQTRDSSGRSAVTAASWSIDRELVAFLGTLAPSELERAQMVVDPESDRLWVCVSTKIYVRSWFPDGNVAGWTEYNPGFTIDDATVANDRVYLRSGNDVYVYGGTTGDEWYEGECEVQLPYANMRAPAALKGLTGLDLGVEGLWQVFIATDTEDFSVAEEIGFIDGPTFSEPAIPLAGQVSHVSLRLLHNEPVRGVISSVTFHYKFDDAD